MALQTVADRYELVDRLGSGGGGVVWRAHDLDLDRTVAVKEIRVAPGMPGDQRERARARALREARAAARLQHPHVVSVYDVRSEDDAIYIVMEHVDAPSLQDLVATSGPLPPRDVARLGTEVLDALAAAHAAGIVHRDVKPSNVLMADRGAVVTDFGIAAVTGDTALTMSGQALGTPDFVSPEQVDDGQVGPATDVWSLGTTLYYAVEGTPPFQRDRSISTVHAVVHADPHPLSRAGALAPVLYEMLAKAPTDRPDVATARARLQEVVDRFGVDDSTTTVIPPVGADPTVEMSAAPPPADTSSPPSPTSATAPPQPVPAGTEEEPGPGRAVTSLGVVAIVAILAVGGVVLANLLPGDTEAPSASVEPTSAVTGPGVGVSPTAGPTTSSAQPTPTTPPTTGPPPTPTPTTTPDATTSAAPTSGSVPDGWQVFDGPTYQVAHPPGWTTREVSAPNNLDLVAPDDSDGYLRVAHTDDPAADVLRDTERIEAAFQQDHAGYQRIRLEPTEYRGTDAVIWEYTFTADGQPYHAIHLNLSTGEYGYALNHVVPAAGWERAAERFEAFTSSFEFRR